MRVWAELLIVPELTSAAMVSSAFSATVPALVRVAVGPVSYTHLTLPTKRIV